MPVIETSNREVKAYKGLHLYHFWLSSCSQRFRERPSFRLGIEGCEIVPALDHFRKYNEQRKQEGTGITAYKPLRQTK